MLTPPKLYENLIQVPAKKTTVEHLWTPEETWTAVSDNRCFVGGTLPQTSANHSHDLINSTLRGTNISHLGKGKIIFKSHMLVSRRVVDANCFFRRGKTKAIASSLSPWPDFQPASSLPLPPMTAMWFLQPKNTLPGWRVLNPKLSLYRIPNKYPNMIRIWQFSQLPFLGGFSLPYAVWNVSQKGYGFPHGFLT